MKVDRTHRLPDLAVYEPTFIHLLHSTVALASALDWSQMQAAATQYSNELARHINHLNEIKPNRKFLPALAFNLYGVEVSILRDSMNNRYMEIKFITDWKFFSNHATKNYYGYVLKVIPQYQ